MTTLANTSDYTCLQYSESYDAQCKDVGLGLGLGLGENLSIRVRARLRLRMTAHGAHMGRVHA